MASSRTSVHSRYSSAMALTAALDPSYSINARGVYSSQKFSFYEIVETHWARLACEIAYTVCEMGRGQARGRGEYLSKSGVYILTEN